MTSLSSVVIISLLLSFTSGQSPITDGLKQVLSGVEITASCLLLQESVDPVLGSLPLNPEVYCSLGAGQALPGIIPGVTCCYPMTTEAFDFKMYLFLPGVDGHEEIYFADKSRKELFEKYQVIVYIIHGYLEIPLQSAWSIKTQEYFNKRGYPVIVVDYSRGDFIQYFQGSANIRTVGKAVGYSIINWNIIEKTLLIGFSHGGQAIGQVGLYVKQQSGGRKVRECHALDPAGFFYDGAPKNAILDKSDCQLVQVIHTGARALPKSLTLPGALVLQQFGSTAKSGHCDYWINCGHEQYEDCGEATLVELTNLNVPSLLSSLIGCSHSKAPVIYGNSLYQTCNFTSYPCPNCGNGNLKCSGNYLGRSNKLPPFSRCNSRMNRNFVLFTNSEENKCESYSKGTVVNPIPEM